MINSQGLSRLRKMVTTTRETVQGAYCFKKPSKAGVIYPIFKWNVDGIIFSFPFSYILQRPRGK
jgi:hypothetical protein